ncbi:MAG: PKD domain-containing protein [Candidatus Thermoplasmatota archaeon]
MIGVSELSVSTLNPNKYTMVGEGMVIFPCYSTLLQYNLDMEVIGDLAEEWSCSSDGLTWYFKIVDNAYFCDPAAPTVRDPTRLLTAEDVEFTFLALQGETDSRLHTYFPDDLITDFNIINDFEFEITIGRPHATIMESWLGAMILPKYYWEGEDFLLFDNAPPIGSGAFYYGMDGLPESGQCDLIKNPIWYGEDNHGWQMHVDKWIIKEELEDTTAWQDVTEGTIDVMLGVNPELYTNSLLPPKYTPYVVGFQQCNGFVYEFNLNQMSDELRQELGGSFTSGTNNQLLLDPTIKLAMSYCVDKDGFIEDVLWGLGQYADSLVGPQNPGHYWYPDPDPYDPDAARQMLYDDGWKYRLDTTLIEPDDPDYDNEDSDGAKGYYPLCKVGGTDPLAFDFVTLNTDNQWSMGAKYLVNSTRLGGFDLDLAIESVSDMNSRWYQADYDVWLWDWVIGTTADPVSTMEIFTEDGIGTDQDVYWVNETFEEVYAEAIMTVDTAARRTLTDQLQALVYEMRGCQTPAYRDELYAVNVMEWAYASLGDWNTSYFLLPDIWPWWLAMQLYPNENNAPDLFTYPDAVEALVDEEEYFSADADDDDDATALEYKWFWGDGTTSTWSSSGSAYHTYDEDGIYQADVAVREASSSKGFEDYFMVSKGFTVTVRDESNDAPTITAMTCAPADPDTGTQMWFNSTATDPEGDEIYYTWTFGDGHTAYGQNVRYQYTEDGGYDVVLSVDDHRVGVAGSRPVTNGAYVVVSQNGPPTITVDDYPDIEAKQTETYTALVSDPDPRDVLRYTWLWGDGEVTVTDVPTADHAYNSRGVYTLVVWADDMTDLDGHNRSDSALVDVVSMAQNKEPVITDYIVSNTAPYTGEEVTFTGVAADPDGNALTLTIAFGDDTFAVESFDPSADNTERTIEATHVYDDADTYTTYFYVFDGIDNVSSMVQVFVEANSAPVITDMEDEYIDTGVEETFTASVFDPDDDTMTYYWTWGDGTPGTVTAAPTATHTYAESGTYQYRLYANDGHSHNSSELALANVNAVPVLTPLDPVSVDAGIEWTFVAEATDPDLMDTLEYRWTFGDGTATTDWSTSNTAAHTYAASDTYTVRVDVTDGFSLATHTLFSEATVTVTDPMVDDPPTIVPLADVTLTVDEEHTFTVTASDPEGQPLVITWDFDDGTGLFVGPSVVHSFAAVATYDIMVYADDGATNVSDTAQVTVVGDEPPVADAGDDQTVNEDSLVYFDGSGSSDDVDPPGVVAYYWTIYDGAVTIATMIGESPSYEFADPGVYTVKLIVEDSIGQMSAPDEIAVTVLDVTNPLAVATADPTSVSMGDTVDFDATGSSDNVEVTDYEWSFFDGVSSVTYDMATASHQFDIAGSFPVTLTVWDAEGNWDEDEVTITVEDTEAPVANAGADDEINVGTTYTLDGSLSSDNDEVVEWEWTFTDGTAQTLSGETADYAFDNIGEFVITLTVTDAAGLTDTDTVTITVSDLEAPAADAGADVSVEEGATVDFDGGLSADNVLVTSYEWEFVYDGATVTLTGVTASHVFDIAGTYTVTLTVADAAGNSDTDTMVVTVTEATVNDPPVADAGADASITVGTAHTFDGSGSSADVDNYTWTFVYDGATVTLYGVGPSHTFGIAGTYTVTLTVADAEGLTDTDTVVVTVTEAGGDNVLPVADAGDDVTATAGEAVGFDGSDSSDSDGTIVSWVWTFEYDGETETLEGETAEFTFDEPGTYTVTLTVTDSDGGTDTDTMTVTVEAEDTPSEGSFLEDNWMYLVLLVIVVVAVVALVLMKRGGSKGASSGEGIEGVDQGQSPPSS